LNPTVSSNAGWISGLSDNGVNRNATTDTYGDSHNNRFRFFTLTQQSQVSFTVTGTTNSVWGNCNGATTCAAGTTNNPLLIGTTASKLNPGVSIFSGLVPASSHDGAGDTNGLSAGAIATMQTPAHNVYLAAQPGFASWSPFYDANDEILAQGGAANVPGNRDKWGVFKSDQNFTMGNNAGAVSGVTFIDAVADAASGAYADESVDNSVSWSGLLGPGTYTMTIGGTSLADLTALFSAVQQGTPGAASVNCTTFGAAGCNGTQWPGVNTTPGTYSNLRLARNMNIAFNVQAVPVPGAVWLFGSALAGLVGLRRRQQLAA
jgi:hypothetical protein